MPFALLLIPFFGLLWGAGRWWSHRKYAMKGGGRAPALPPSWEAYFGARAELRGWPENTVLNVPGIAATTPAARAALLDVASMVGTSADALAIVISHESGWKSDAHNPFGAFGLIQVTHGADLPGYRTDAELQAVLGMSPEQQLLRIVVAFYLREKRARGADPGRLGMLNFLPAHVDQPDDYVLARKGDPKTGKIYEANAPLNEKTGKRGGFDPDPSKGFFTIADVKVSFYATAKAANGQRITVDGSVIDGTTGAPDAPAAPSSAPPPSAPTKPAPAPRPAAPRPVASAPRPAPAAPPGPPHDQYNIGYVVPQPDPALYSASPDHLSSGRNAAGATPPKPAASPVQSSNARSLDAQRAEETQNQVAADYAASQASQASQEKSFLDQVADYASQVTSAGCACDDALDTTGFHYDPYASSIVSSGPGDSAAGLLLAAARAGKLKPFGFWEVQIPHLDLIVTMLREPLQAMVDGEWLALGVSSDEQRAICQILGLLPATSEIVDAAHEAAQVQIAGRGLRKSDADDARMHSIGFAKQHTANVRAAIAAKSSDPDVIARDWGKSLIIHPKNVTAKGYTEYGWRGPDGRPLQPEQAGHGPTYGDYSQLPENLVQPMARRISDENVTVDLFAEYKRWFPGAAMAQIIDSYRSPSASTAVAQEPYPGGDWNTSITSAGEGEDVLVTWPWTIQYDVTERPARLVRTGNGNLEVRFDGLDGGMRQVPVDTSYQPPRLDRVPAGLTNLATCGQEVGFAVRVLLGYVIAQRLPLGTVIPFWVEGGAYAARLEAHSNAAKGLSTYAGTPEGASA